MARDLKRKDFEHFVAVCETGGFSEAAKKLKTAQSNVSTRIAGLERLLGAALVERHYRKITITRAGRRLYWHAKQIISGFHAAENAVRAGREARGVRKRRIQTRKSR